MVLVGVDTSGKNGSLALARVPEGDTVGTTLEMVEVVPLSGGTFSAQLIPQLADLLARHGFSKVDISGFPVVSGPGSFTGLRVGLAAVKGLAEVLAKPIAAVSLLEVVARAGVARPLIWSALDAGRGEVYLGKYELSGKLTARCEILVSRAELIETTENTWVVTPDESVAEVLRSAGRNVELVTRPGSADAVRLGWEKLRAGAVVSPEELEANYIRRSDAEIFKPVPVRSNPVAPNTPIASE